MKPLRRLRRRSLIRVVSFITAAFFVTIGIAVSGFKLAYNYRLLIENNYTNSLNELSYYVGNMDATLTKGMYAGTDTQFILLSSQLATQAAQAKNNLSKLPQSGVRLDATYRFLSQVGEYAMNLSKRIATNERITQTEWRNLQKLQAYADLMAQEIAVIQELAQDQKFIIGQVHAAVSETKNSADTTAGQTQPEQTTGAQGRQTNQKDTAGIKNISDGFAEIETGFTEYPSLIYDGPFSDHIMNAQPKLIMNKAEVSADQAQYKAAQIVGLEPAQLTHNTDENSVMPSYCFTAEGFNVNITKQGGYPVYMFNTRNVGAATLSKEDAIQRAKRYLSSIGYENMEQTYSSTSGGICTINFAYQLDNVTIYTDFIKVSVALDNGGIVGFDARGYIMNHYSRKTPVPTITREDGLRSVSPLLTVQKSRLVIIPSEGENQVFCYEYTCTGQNNERVLVYVNAETGVEEQILIVINNGEGDLTI